MDVQQGSAQHPSAPTPNPGRATGFGGDLLVPHSVAWGGQPFSWSLQGRQEEFCNALAALASGQPPHPCTACLWVNAISSWTKQAHRLQIFFFSCLLFYEINKTLWTVCTLTVRCISVSFVPQLLLHRALNSCCHLALCVSVWELPWKSTHELCSIPPGWLAYLLLTPSNSAVSSSVGCKGTKSCLSPMWSCAQDPARGWIWWSLTDLSATNTFTGRCLFFFLRFAEM